MRKILLLILAIITISCNGQEEIDFKVGHLPNHDYTLSQKQMSENIINYIATDEILQSLKNNGVENPTITKDTVLLKSISRTGSLEGNEFPINIELLESNKDRKSTRLNSSHVKISYAVFCLKKKKNGMIKILKYQTLVQT